MVQTLYKNWLLVSKITWGSCITSDKQWKAQKVEIRWATFIQKNTFLQLKHIQMIYLILLSTTCENSPNCLCHFWNHKLFFTTQILCIFLAQTLHTFYKSNSSNCKFWGFPLLALKSTKFLMSFFRQKVIFSSKFELLFSVMRNNSSILFSAEPLHATDKNSTSKCKFSDLPV